MRNRDINKTIERIIQEDRVFYFDNPTKKEYKDLGSIHKDIGLGMLQTAKDIRNSVGQELYLVYGIAHYQVGKKYLK